MVDISDKERLIILKHYLGKFCCRIDPKVRKELSERITKPVSYYIRGTQDFLKQAACFYLLSFGQQQYRSLYTYEIVDLFLGNHQAGDETEGQAFYDTETPLLIIYHMASTMENRQLENMTGHTITQRQLEGKQSLVLSECVLPKIEALTKELKWGTCGDKISTKGVEDI